MFLKHINQTTHNIQAASTCGENITFKIILVYRVIFVLCFEEGFFLALLHLKTFLSHLELAQKWNTGISNEYFF